MKKILLLVDVVLAVVYIQIRSFKNETSFFNQEDITQKDELRVYLIGVLACEMPASFNDEALKAQAVASRTYAYYIKNSGRELTNDNRTQCLIDEDKMKQKWGKDFDKYYSKIENAIDNTSNEVVTYDGKVISAYYFSKSNGYTENSINVFKENKPYLVSVASKENIDNTSYQQSINISFDEFRNKLNIDGTIKIGNIKKDEASRVLSIEINNKNFEGTYIRKIFGLNSTDFKIELRDNNVKISSIGHGHGVGMSQYGAQNLAKEGYNYKDILNYYYTNIKIENINSIK